MARFLFPIGGNEKKAPDSEIFRQMVQLAGGSDASIIVVPTASETPTERAQDYHELFSAFSPRSIQTVHIGERPDAASPEFLDAVGSATLLMFAGGDQLKLSSLIGGTPLHDALVARYESGGCIVAGTSAGAAVLPETMIYQNNRFRLYRKGGIEMTKGLGLIRNLVFDTHFVQRSRISRLVHAVATNPALLGFGLEENTGVIIEDERKATVVGDGTVIVVDGRQMEINHIGYADNGQPFAVTNVTYSVLTSGVVFDIEQRRVTDAGPTALPASTRPKARQRGRKRR